MVGRKHMSILINGTTTTVVVGEWLEYKIIYIQIKYSADEHLVGGIDFWGDGGD